MVSTGVYCNTLDCMEEDFSDYIVRSREAIGLSQAQLADRAGVSRQIVNRLENGVTKLPTPVVRRALAQTLGVSHLELLVAAGELTADEAGVMTAEDSAALRALRPILEGRDLSDKQVRQIADMVRGMLELMEG